jgi:glycine betaine/proline transport system substrate-binding protein
MKTLYAVATGLSAALLASSALAVDPESCATVTMSDPGWTDITSTNSLATVVLEGLGYEPEVKTLSVPVAFEALKTNDIDVFLGNWMPAQEKFRAELEAAGAIDVVGQNLEGAKFTLAAPSYAGINDFADLAEHAEALDSSIYGIEPGAVANQNMQRMIEANDFGLAGWKVVESSEQAMLAQVRRAVDAQEPIVFLAWAPHPMNTNFELTYLAGGDEYFGPNYGGAEVYTLARKGFAAECPNLGTFFSNLVFTVDMENQMMGKILDEGMAGPEAAKAWLSENPEVLDAWLDGVTTLSGEPGLPAVKESLGL